MLMLCALELFGAKNLTSTNWDAAVFATYSANLSLWTAVFSCGKGGFPSQKGVHLCFFLV